MSTPMARLITENSTSPVTPDAATGLTNAPGRPAQQVTTLPRVAETSVSSGMCRDVAATGGSGDTVAATVTLVPGHQDCQVQAQQVGIAAVRSSISTSRTVCSLREQ